MENIKQRYAPQLERSGDWRDDANCKDGDPERFFQSKGSETAETLKQTKAICAACLAQLACLSYALDNNIDYGIWGGLTEEERRKLKRRQV